MKKSPNKTLQLHSSPEYVVYTDSALEQACKQYFEMALTGREWECVVSKELRCRLMRNTVTSMISILRASQQGEEVQYPSKREVNAMARRLVEYYMLQDKDKTMKHVSDFRFLSEWNCIYHKWAFTVVFTREEPTKEKASHWLLNKWGRRLKIMMQTQAVDQKSFCIKHLVTVLMMATVHASGNM